MWYSWRVVADGGIVAMPRIHGSIVGQNQELSCNAVQLLPEGLGTAGPTRPAGEKGISGKQVLAHQKAVGAVGMAGGD